MAHFDELNLPGESLTIEGGTGVVVASEGRSTFEGGEFQKYLLLMDVEGPNYYRVVERWTDSETMQPEEEVSIFHVMSAAAFYYNIL